MHQLEIPETIRRMVKLYYQLGIWSDQSTYREWFRRNFYYIFVVSFSASVAGGAYTTRDPDDSIFLLVVSLLLTVHLYRFWLVLWRKNEIFSFLQQIGTRNTDDQSEFNRMSKFLTFVRYFLFILLGVISTMIVFPLFNNKKLVFNILFPLDRTNSEIGFWITYVYYAIGCAWSGFSTCFTTISWYLMLSVSFDYKWLGRQLERAGESQLKISPADEQKFFSNDFVKAIQEYNKINGILGEFGTRFGALFFWQVATGSLCICGSVYTLAFSSHEDLIIDGVNCALLLYSLFDIFMVMFFGNEIKLASDKLSRCLYNSNWIEQTQSSKRSVIILGERLKQPLELVVGRIYPLNMQTFGSIMNGAYSMLNVLQNLRE